MVHFLNNVPIRLGFKKEDQEMTNENVETIKADAKKVISDLENIMSHAKADAENAKSEKVELNVKVTYAKPHLSI